MAILLVESILFADTKDGTCEVGYLETDRPENVGFYAKSGFELTSEMNLLGVPNWFMHRYRDA